MPSLLHSDKLCPYCLDELKAKDIKLVCPICGKQYDMPSGLGGFAAKIRPVRCTEPGCHNAVCSQKVHSVCGNMLPADILDYSKYLRFSVIGTTGSGKTNYLTTMLHEMQNEPGIPWLLSSMNDETQDIYEQNEDLIYYERKPVESTTPGTPPVPMQWKIRDKTRMSSNTIACYSLTIFDGAGEDQAHPSPTISRYISGSKTLMILIDPLTLRGIKNVVDSDIYDWSKTADLRSSAATNLVNKQADYIRSSCGKGPKALIDKDVAIIFTKMDTVMKTFGQARVTQPSPHVGAQAFVRSDAEQVDQNIRSWLTSHNETAFLNAVDTNFKAGKVHFFGVSSFGQPPTGLQKLGRVMPHRVLDPMYWMLAEEGIVPYA